MNKTVISTLLFSMLVLATLWPSSLATEQWDEARVQPRLSNRQGDKEGLRSRLESIDPDVQMLRDEVSWLFLFSLISLGSSSVLALEQNKMKKEIEELKTQLAKSTSVLPRFTDRDLTPTILQPPPTNQQE